MSLSKIIGKEPIALAKYDGLTIEFLRSGRYVNLAQMASATGKRVRNWTRLDSTKQLIKAFDSSPVYRGMPAIKTKQGGDQSNSSDLSCCSLTDILRGNLPPGSWAHPDIAIQFAQWASPAFALWVSRKIRELAEYGEVNLHRSEWTVLDIDRGRELNAEDIAELIEYDRLHRH